MDTVFDELYGIFKYQKEYRRLYSVKFGHVLLLLLLVFSIIYIK